ncbi:MAG: hypothetical protein ACI4EX_14300 [Lachnospiraceae bacterium]
MKALTYKQYRAINIFILAIIFFFAETAIALGANVWFPELPYTLSLSVIYISLEMMRWGGFGAVAAVTSGLAFCLASGANGEQFLIYCIGNLMTLFALLYLKKIGTEKVRKDGTLTVTYVLLVFLLAQIGRWLVSTCLGHDPLMIIQFITTDALSGFFGAIVILVLRNADGMFENQKSYLLRLEEERRMREQEE